MSVQLWAKMQGTEEYINLSLFDADPVKLTLSVTSIQDPLAATSVFSKTFRVPHNSINGPYFKGVFNVNSIDFDASIKADAYILDNGQLFTRGNIRLINVFNANSENSIEYEIIFTGETSDFGAKIGGGFLNELDFTEYNHERALTNIEKSWDLNLFGGDLVYGLIEWGYTYDKNNRPNIPTLSNGFEKSFTNVANPLDNSQWKPQFRAKAIWDKVFANVGYTYDSDFLNSDFFKKMYVITENKAEAVGANNTGAEGRVSYVQYENVGSTIKVNFNTEISDNGNNYDPSTSTYTCPATGTYTATVRLDIGTGTNTQFDSFSIAGSIRAVDADTNVTLASVGYYVGVGSQTLNATLNFTANPGQKIIIQMYSTCATGTGCNNGSTDLRIYAGSVVFATQSNIFSINSIMPNNVRTIDFMRSIINRFRLVFVPSKDKTNHFTITPWKDWILQGEAIDWTNKVNGNISAKSSPIFYTQNRFNIFKDQEDSDYLNYDYQLQYKQTFGQLNLDSANELITGTKTYQDQFAAAPLAPIGFKEGDTEAPKFVIPHIAKDTGASQDATTGSPIVGKREAVQPKLRLVFYNGTRQAPLTWYTKDYAGGAVAYTKYPLMSQYSEFPVTPTTFDLCWSNVPPYWDTEITELGNGKTSNTSFTTYWKSWYDTTFDPYSRIVELEVQLDYSDLINFRFNDYVFIQDSWYFVNEVKDYIVGQNTLCKVQLIKVGNNVGITLPIVVDNKLTQITLCKGATACDAYCCKPYSGAESNTYWINGTSLSDSSAIYINSGGTQFASAGYYSDGINAVELNGFGGIASRPDISGCTCTPTTYTYTVERVTTTPCDLYCNTNPVVVVYSTSSTFIDSTYLFLDAALTIPASAGFYAPVDTFSALQVGANGQVLVIASLADCNCDVYYPFTVCQGTIKCDSCCCPNGTMVIYGTNPSFELNNYFYLDNTGTTPAPDAWYKYSVSDITIQISGGNGNVDGQGTCTSCPSCDAGPVQVTYGIGGSEPGYVSSVILEKSYDNVNWIQVGTLTFTSGASLEDTVGLEEGVWVRAIFTSTTIGGDLYTYYFVNNQTVFYNINATPTTRTIYSTGTITAANTYKLSGYISGGTPRPTSKFVATGGYYDQYQGGGFPSSGGGSIGSILGLNSADASVATAFDVSTGFNFTDFPDRTKVQSIVSYGDKIYVTGIFNQYKGQSIANRIACLNLDGTLDQTFNTNAGTGLTYVNGSALFMYSKLWISPGGNLYLTGQGDTYNGIPNNSISGYLFMRINPDGTRDTSFNNAPFGINDLITSIQFIGETLYVTGSFTGYQTTPAGRIISINQDGSINTSLNAGTGFNRGLNDMVLYNGKMYISTNGVAAINYNGTSYSGGIISINIDGTPNSTFNSGITTGFDGQCDALTADSTGVYTTGEYGKYNGIDSYRISKLGFDGTLNTTFNNYTNPFTPVSTDRIEMLLSSDDSLYVWGQFDTYRGTTCHDLIKINKTDASYVSQFAVGQGFNNGANTDKVITLFEVDYQTPITLYPIQTNYSSSTPCNSYCPGSFPNTVYANASPLINATSIYTNSNGTTPVVSGYYSDGSSIVQVDDNGLVIGNINIGACQCNTLYQFDVIYGTDECTACELGIPVGFQGPQGPGTPVTVYGANPTWSQNTTLYSNITGSTFASSGWYAYSGSIVLQVGSNGTVIATGDCQADCTQPVGDCREVSVINISPGQLELTWQNCDGSYSWSYLDYGEDTSGWPEFACPGIIFGTLSVIGGRSRIIWGANC